MQPEVPFSTTTVKIWSDSVKNWRGYERKNQTIKEEYSFSLQMTLNVKVTFKVTRYFIWPKSYMDYRDLSDQFVTQYNV